MQLDGTCPYCGETISVWVDEGGGLHQRYIEDCAVCCRPIEVFVAGSDEDGEAQLSLHRDDD